MSAVGRFDFPAFPSSIIESPNPRPFRYSAFRNPEHSTLELKTRMPAQTPIYGLFCRAKVLLLCGPDTMKRKDLPGAIFKERTLVAACVMSFLLISGLHLHATPIRVTVRAKGLTTVDVTFGPILTNMQERRSRCGPTVPKAIGCFWTPFKTKLIKTATITCELAGYPDSTSDRLRIGPLPPGAGTMPVSNGLPTLYKELGTRGRTLPSLVILTAILPVMAGVIWTSLEMGGNRWVPIPRPISVLKCNTSPAQQTPGSACRFCGGKFFSVRDLTILPSSEQIALLAR